ncbi:MAG: phosphatase PAP2 family protein [Pseudomonadales bacterium]|jgi:undecaprenyl-diphosphatase|nr:phosphatase PAP2 family protein [Pseudomonadales bacterium]
MQLATILKNKKIVFALISFLLFVLVVVGLLTSSIYNLDTATFYFLSKNNIDCIGSFLRIITNAGNVVYLACLCAILTLLFWKQKWGFLPIINFFGIAALSQVLKYIFVRERPDPLLRGGYSFPSAHTMLATAVLGFLIYLIITKTNWSKVIKVLVSSLLGVIILLVGISRVYLGYHFASDVLAGIFVSVAYLLVFIFIIDDTPLFKNACDWVKKQYKQLSKRKTIQK